MRKSLILVLAVLSLFWPAHLASAPGEVAVTMRDGKIEVVSEGASLQTVLQALASFGAFEWESLAPLDAETLSSAPQTYRANSLEDLLALLLPRYSYLVAYDLEGRIDRLKVLSLVVVSESLSPESAERRSEPHDEILLEEVRSIGEAGPPDGIERLIALSRPDQALSVRRAAVMVMGRYPAATGQTALIEALEDESPWVRLEAVRALYGRGDPAVRSALEDLTFVESHPRVLDLAERLLQEIPAE